MSTQQLPARVLIADDHPVIVAALSEMLDSALDMASIRIDSVSDGDRLLQILEDDLFDYLVMDLHMPGKLQSVSLLRAVLEKQPHLQVIIYTGTELPSLALTTLETGACAFVSKSSHPGTIVEAVLTVMRGSTYTDPAVDIASAKSHPWRQLSSAEQTVVLALARGENLQAIALDSNRSYKTITTHKYNALRKLGLKSKDELCRYLEMHGLGHLLQ